MQQENKIVALRLAGAGPEPTRDKPAMAPPLLSRELAEDLRWVLRQIQGIDVTRSARRVPDHAGTRRFVWISLSTAGLIATGALLWTVAASERPLAWLGYPGHAGPQISIATDMPTDGREHRAAFDLLRIEDATRVQQRLADLGFFVGTPNGSWGPRSRAALREFKSANGLSPDDHWNASIQARLFALDARHAVQRADAQPPEMARPPQRDSVSPVEAFVGTWASDAAECRPALGAGVRISRRRAEGYGGVCSFGSVQREGSAWRVKAVCAGSGTTWNANINLAVSGDRLRWSSERGTTVYVRCNG